MDKLSFRHKILLLLIICMCVSQTSTMLATLASTERSVRSSMRREIDAAQTQINQLFLARYRHLRELGQSLIADPAFAVAADTDAARLQELLESAILRGDATHALYVAPDGTVQAVAGPTDLSALAPQLHSHGIALQVQTLDRRQYQVAALPAADGTLILGMAVDERLAQEFRSSTGLHLSLFDLANKYRSDIVSTLPGQEEQELIGALQQFGLLHDSVDGVDLTFGSGLWLGEVHALQGSGNQLFAIIQKSLDAQMEPYYRVKEDLLMLLVQVVFVAVLGSIYIGSRIVKPIKQLADLATRIGQGNYNVGIRATGHDEIGKLGASINTMQREIAKREQKILFQAQHDELTGLPNRYLIRDRIQGAIARAARDSGTFVVVMLDVARFKQINDTLGHEVGDQVLREIAGRLRDNLRRSDTLARLGSDDFMLVQEQSNLAAAIDKVHNQLVPALSVPFRIDGSELFVKCQFGLVEYPAHGENAEELLRRAEMALFEAKASPQALAVYQPGCDMNHFREFTIVSDLDKALSAGALSLCYQPKVNLRTGSAAQVEALVRWEHPGLGALRPDEFIGVLERTGNINRLTHWIIGEACRQCRAWLDNGLDVRISVNLSALDLLDGALPAVIQAGMTAHRVPIANLVFEITESAVMQNPEVSLALLATLNDAGFRLALDDYGTGYSSLAQVKNLPISELKIDQSFVRELEQDGQDAIIVRSTIELAHSMGLEVVAEGVETESALALLRQMGCDHGQGYLFCKPVNAAAFEDWYRSKQAELVTGYLKHANAA
jgi:diguanylate cyclase (GGDEF)-like protein